MKTNEVQNYESIKELSTERAPMLLRSRHNSSHMLLKTALLNVMSQEQRKRNHSFDLLQNQIRYFQPKNKYLSEKVNKISHKAKLKKSIKHIQRVVDKNKIKSQPNISDILLMKSSINKINHTATELGKTSISNFKDEMKDLYYLKKLQKNKKKQDSQYRSRMQRIHELCEAENDPEKLKLDAQKLMREIKDIHRQFDKIVAPKEAEVDSIKAKALLQNQHNISDIEKPNLSKNIGHQRLSRHQVNVSQIFPNLPKCFRRRTRKRLRDRASGLPSQNKRLTGAAQDKNSRKFRSIKKVNSILGGINSPDKKFLSINEIQSPKRLSADAFQKKNILLKSGGKFFHKSKEIANSKSVPKKKIQFNFEELRLNKKVSKPVQGS